MAVIIDGSGGIGSEEQAAFTPLGSEETIYSFDQEHVVDAQRLQYRADESGMVYYLIESNEAVNAAPGAIATVAGQYAAMWNANYKVPGVQEIAEVQQVTPLGSLRDVAQVAVVGTNPAFTTVITVPDDQYRTDLFAAAVAGARKTLDTLAGLST